MGCDRVRPRFRYPGSGWARNADDRIESYGVTFLSAVTTPARTVGVGDAYTLVTPNGTKVASGFGCEARYRHGDGGNFAMLDGHARYLPGDAKGYTEQDIDGCWFETYFTFDR